MNVELTCLTPDAAPACPAAEGCPEQRTRREARAKLVALWQAAVEQGSSCAAASTKLEVCPRTLRHWRTPASEDSPARSPGRPAYALDRARRKEILASLRELGPRAGVEVYKRRFAEVPRRVLAQFKERYFRSMRRYRRRHLARLEWTRPGAVWSMDHAQPPLPIDGKYEYILSVRDLSTGWQLAWLPIRKADAATTVLVLGDLFVAHGAPLVVKSDNGKALTQGDVPACLARHGVTPLVSPAYRPQYNGSCEAGVGAVKLRTEDAAFVANRSRHWTSEDLEHALHVANNAPSDKPGAPARRARWEQRVAVTPEERAAFQSAVTRERALLDAESAEPRNKAQALQRERRNKRQSVAHTLVESGLLIIHRRPNTPDIKSTIAARIT
jgi:transposase InsO family protein